MTPTGTDWGGNYRSGGWKVVPSPYGTTPKNGLSSPPLGSGPRSHAEVLMAMAGREPTSEACRAAPRHQSSGGLSSAPRAGAVSLAAGESAMRGLSGIGRTGHRKAATTAPPMSPGFQGCMAGRSAPARDPRTCHGRINNLLGTKVGTYVPRLLVICVTRTKRRDA